jgi:hypothetical protein
LCLLGFGNKKKETSTLEEHLAYQVTVVMEENPAES